MKSLGYISKNEIGSNFITVSDLKIVLQGLEIWETKLNTNRKVLYYLIVDTHFTWWIKGRSYLCRIVDSLHMGLVDEVLFGKEVLDRIPALAKSWIKRRKV